MALLKRQINDARSYVAHVDPREKKLLETLRTMPAIVLLTATQIALGIQTEYLREVVLEEILEPAIPINPKPKLRLVG